MDTKTPNQKLTQKSVSGSHSARRLGLWVVALAALIFAFVPLAINPGAIMLYVPAAFYLIKFKLLMYLSAALLAAVLGATLLGARPVKLPVLLPALAYLGISALSTLFSGDIMRSLTGATNRHDGLLTLAAGVLLFYSTARFLDSWAKVRVFLIAGVTSAVIISVYGILQQFGLDPVLQMGIPWYVDLPRAFSTLGNPIFLAAYLTLMVGAGITLYFRSAARWERGLWLLVLAVIAACWFYTHTRGSMLGLGVALPIILWLAHHRLGSMKPLVLPLSALLTGIAIAATFSNLSVNNTDTALRSPQWSNGGTLQSAALRPLIWRDTIPVILERPLLGYGPDNFAGPFKRHEGGDLRAFFQTSGAVIDKAHNEFLQVAATTGLLGLAAYIWVFVSYFRHSYRSGGWELLALSGGVLAYILQLQTAFTTIATGVTFWAILGVSVAVMRVQQSEMHRMDEDDFPAREMDASRSGDIQ